MQFDSFEELEDCFNLFDRNHNGLLDTQELGHALRAMGLNPSLGQIETLLKSVDTNHRGQINLQQFSNLFGMVKPIATVSKDQLIRELTKFDKDNNGFIDSNELRNILTARGEPVDAHHVEEIIRDFDTNGDGRLSIEELAVGLLGKPR